MSSYGTILQQGNFTSNGSATTIQLRGGVDWMRVYNITQLATEQSTGRGVEFYWQNGFPAGAQLEYKKTNSTDALNAIYLTTGGFTFVNSTVNNVGPILTTITAISNATIPVVTNSGTNGLTAGSVVRLYNVSGAQQLGGMDFTVGYNTLSTTTFSLDYMQAIATATSGNWAVVPYDPYFYPPRRFITNIVSSGSSSVITLSVTHQYQVGQAVRVIVPSIFGMTQINNMIGNITAINTNTSSGNTITVDINSSSFTSFTFPLSASVPFSPALVIPVGEDTADALAVNGNILSDATNNTGYIGMLLNGGAQSPAGSNGDQIYWQAGVAWSVNNTI